MSKIEWTDETWNPIAGCSLVSPGCTHCYAMQMAARIERMNPSLEHYKGLTQPSKAGPVWTGKVALAPEKTLTEPLRRRKPTRYFVNSMSDLFHEDVPDEWIDRIFAIMALAPQHTFQVLTKRSARMRACATRRIDGAVHDIGRAMKIDGDRWRGRWQLPLPNVWLGVSCEDQRRADERIPDLLATPAAVRFVSAEPLLGQIFFSTIEPDASTVIHALMGGTKHLRDNYEERGGAKLDWIIVGGESGPGARPMHPEWVRQIRDDCNVAEVAFFFKQWGAWQPVGQGPWMPTDVIADVVAINGARSRGDLLQGGPDKRPLWCSIVKTGKDRAGRHIDGRTWDEFPEPGKRVVQAVTESEPAA